MTPKGKQDYGIKYHGESQRIYGIKEKKEKKKKKRAENERAGEIRRKEGSGIKWNVKEKKEMMESYEYTCVVDKMQEKKKRKRKMKRMDERNAKNQKSQFKNTTTIFSQYFHNKF